MAIQLLAAEKYWKTILTLAGLTAGGVIGGMFYLQDKQAADPANAAPVVATEQVETAADLESPSAEQEQATVNEVQQVEVDTEPQGPFSADAGAYYHYGYYRSDYGYCTFSVAKNDRAMAHKIEASVGRRIHDYSGFSDGMIIEFNDGTRKVVWAREIDCKDPPYNPFRE